MLSTGLLMNRVFNFNEFNFDNILVFYDFVFPV